MKKKITFLFFCGLAIMQAQDFTTGNLVVSFNNPTGTASQAGLHKTISLQEFTTSGAAVGTALSTARGTDDRRVAWEGQLALSADGRFLTFPGRNIADGTAVAAARAATLSLVRIAKNKALTYTDITPTDGAFPSFNNVGVRSTATVDGSEIYVATSGAAATQGTRLVTFGNSATSTQHTTYQTRYVGIWNNDILTASQDNPPVLTLNGAVLTLGVGGDLGGGVITTMMFDVDPAVPGNDLLYLARPTSGILKYSFNAATSIWDFKGQTNNITENTSGFTVMTGQIESGKPVLYAIKIDAVAATTSSWIYKVTDNVASSVDWNSGGANNATHLLIATSNTATNQTFRGIAFAPTGTLSNTSFNKTATGLMVYPTQDKNIITISNNGEPISIVVYNTSGQQVLIGDSQGVLLLNISSLEAGVYFARTKAGESIRFIK
jgi:hypothetical protein